MFKWRSSSFFMGYRNIIRLHLKLLHSLSSSSCSFIRLNHITHDTWSTCYGKIQHLNRTSSRKNGSLSFNLESNNSYIIRFKCVKIKKHAICQVETIAHSKNTLTTFKTFCKTTRSISTKLAQCIFEWKEWYTTFIWRTAPLYKGR